MDVSDFIVMVIIIVAGLVALFAGFRAFLILLPIWGLIVGFAAGAQVMATILGEGFLGSFLGIVVGIITGLVFALLSYLWWWVGVIVVVGAAGYALGYAILPAMGVDASFVAFLLGLAGAAIFAFAAVVLRLPRVLVIIATSFWGSGAVIAGLLILFGDIASEDIVNGGVAAVVSNSVLWLIVYFVLAVVGAFAQFSTTSSIVLEPGRTDEYSPSQP
jgi:Domain of unknown function (DUF4203)